MYDILPIPPAPAFFDQRVVDVGADWTRGGLFSAIIGAMLDESRIGNPPFVVHL